MKKKILIITILGIVLIAAGIGTYAALSKKDKPKKETVKEETTSREEAYTEAETTQTETTTTEEKPKYYSMLTGEAVSKKIANRRPIAVMINNIVNADPQSGTASAGVIYEATVEGGITRMMALYDDYDDVARIGSVRSCRFYFAYWATEWDAYYIHWGQSSYALDFLKSGKVDTLNAFDDSAYTTFEIRSDIAAPHNIFALPDGIKKVIKQKGYDTKKDSDFESPLTFAEYGTTVTLDKGKNAKELYTNYPVNGSYFLYDEEKGVYKRYQYGQKHKDALTNKQLRFTNLIVQWADAPLFDDGKSVNFNIVGSGKGLFFTGGKYINITWKKESATSKTYFYDEDGNEITLNTGKTCICVMPSSQEVTINN